MLQDSPKNTANEKQLFHGTSSNLVDAICKQNFDWRMGRKHGKKYGKGSYFAIQASRSHCYTEIDVDGDYFMFLARVLVGLYAEGKSTYRRPPLKDPTNPASDLYDSCVDNQYSPTIFVVFDMDQCYPEYVIKYLKQENCSNSRVQNANIGPPSRRLRSIRVSPYSSTRVHRPKTAPANPQENQLLNPRRSSERLGSDSVLSSSRTNVQWPHKAPENSETSLACQRMSRGQSSSNILLPFSPTSVRRPNKAPGDAQVNEQLAKPGRSSERLSFNRALPSSPSSVDSRGDSQSAYTSGPAGGLTSNRELSARFSNRQYPGEGPGDSRGNTTTPGGSSTRRISNKTSCCSCLIL